MEPQVINRFVADAAMRTPDADAFRFKDQQLSYGDLARRASQMAYSLRAQGLRKGDKVGLCLERCLEACVAVYGVLQAGGVVVALDPAAPAKRHAGIICRTDMKILIAHQETAPLVAQIVAQETPLRVIIGLESQIGTAETMGWSDLHALPEAPITPVSPDDDAYVIFTSGSTGVPKGILHSHASAAAYATMAATLYDLGTGSVIANHAPTHFDVSFFGLHAAPHAGTTTVFVSKPQSLFFPALARLLQDEKVTHWYSLSSVAQKLFSMDGLDSLDLSALRWAKICGDPITNTDLAALMATLPHVRFSHSYGPSEVNQCTYYHFDTPPPDDQHHPVIGHMTPGSHGVILDDEGVAVGQDRIGSLWVHGASMMTGYLGDEDRNAKAFLILPGPDGTPVRYYNTGDLFHLDADGLLHFHGRKDRLTKFRGVRLDLDEVESVLRAHPAVQDAAAFLSHCTSVLHGVVVLMPGAAENAASLKEHCAQNLPRLAVPGAIDLCETFPLTGSGKIDRVALQRELDHSTAPPSTGKLPHQENEPKP